MEESLEASNAFSWLLSFGSFSLFALPGAVLIARSVKFEPKFTGS